jgi:ubiquinone/menaquinone biosynthesis C-methylase UbiE
MGLGRRSAALDDASAWVFNRMASVYDARPAYPAALVEALVGLAAPGRRVLDVGAGIGHLALPLAALGLDVTAVEPAREMLTRLEARAAAQGQALRTLHATAESMPVDDASFDLAVIADALHFLDAERVGAELDRVLVPGGALAIVTAELGPAPFMDGLVALMRASAPRRPRDVSRTIKQVAALARAEAMGEVQFTDAQSVDPATLERILRSISFIGPAMSPARFETFRAAVHALPGPPLWTRTLTLRRYARPTPLSRGRRGP